MKYLYLIEKGKNNFSAYVPDLPGCVSTGKTKKDMKKIYSRQFHFTWRACRRMKMKSRSLPFIPVL